MEKLCMHRALRLTVPSHKHRAKTSQVINSMDNVWKKDYFKTDQSRKKNSNIPYYYYSIGTKVLRPVSIQSMSPYNSLANTQKLVSCITHGKTGTSTALEPSPHSSAGVPSFTPMLEDQQARVASSLPLTSTQAPPTPQLIKPPPNT